MFATFDKPREKAGASFQIRDLRAKAAIDTHDLAHSQKLFGHKNRTTIEIYTNDHIEEIVKPLKRKLKDGAL